MDGHQDERDDPAGEGLADDLLRRALLDPEAAAAVALKVHGLALSDALTVVFHGRRDLATLQAADTVLAICPEPLERVAESYVTLVRSVDLDIPLPAHRLMPVALVAPEK